MITLHENTIQNAKPGRWTDGDLPPNVQVGPNTVIMAAHAFKRFRSLVEPALTIGGHCTMDGVHFSLGAKGQVHIGDHCYFTNALLLCEAHLDIGNFVVLGWNVTVADSDFHPVAPAERLADTIACSPLHAGQTRRQLIACRPVVIEDDVWIGPNATILKGVRIGEGAFIEPGAMVTHSVPAHTRVMGNPAKVVEDI